MVGRGKGQEWQKWISRFVVSNHAEDFTVGRYSSEENWIWSWNAETASPSENVCVGTDSWKCSKTRPGHFRGRFLTFIKTRVVVGLMGWPLGSHGGGGIILVGGGGSGSSTVDLMFGEYFFIILSVFRAFLNIFSSPSSVKEEKVNLARKCSCLQTFANTSQEAQKINF